MIKKPKTVALRVTEEEHAAIRNEIGRIIGLSEEGPIKARTIDDVLRYWVNLNIEGAVNDMRKQQKAAEAKAKRQATREAKKAQQ